MSNDNHDTIFRALAQYAHNNLVSKTRDNGETFLSFARDTPEWLARLARDAHNDELPNDWRYNAMSAMLEQLAECEDEDARDEVQHEVCDSLVDVYTGDRIAWLAGNVGRIDACNDAKNENLAGDSPDILDMIGAGQYHELSATWHAIVSFLNDAAERLDDGESVTRYTTGHNMPGFMPDSEPVAFLSFEDARNYIDELASEYAELFEDERDNYNHGSAEFVAADKNAAACFDAGNFAGNASEPFTVIAAGRAYWVVDNGLTIDHEAI